MQLTDKNTMARRLPYRTQLHNFRIRSDVINRIRLLMFSLTASLAVSYDAFSQTLLIHGGGPLAKECQKAFLDSAGKEAKLVVIPTASANPKKLADIQDSWRKLGFKQVDILDTRDRDKANDPNFVKPLQGATAVWISGGSQSRLAEAYAGTLVEKTLIELQKNRVVIGGSSAGAAIQSSVMIFGGSQEPKISKGLGLLQNVIIDQHFLARSRINRLIKAVYQHPDKVGVGIGERTSLIVNGANATVSGDGFVLTIKLVDDKIDIRSYGRGEKFSLPKNE